MKEDTRNLYLAIGLSLVVILGWNFFVGMPGVNRARTAQEQAQTTPAPGAPPNAVTPASPASRPENPGLPPGPGQANAALSRADALAASPRIAIDTPSIAGSIALRGGRIDDVALKGYRETIDPNSPNIVLLSPAGSPEPYYAETGFFPTPGSQTALPGRDTLWTSEPGALTPDHPVALTWDNGQGLRFTRKIAVDSQYLFTVTDTVDNTGAAPVALAPYALVTRVGTPKVSGYAVLFEGMLGVIGDSRVQEIGYASIDKEATRTQALDGTGGWIGFTDKYWAATVIPDQKEGIKGVFRSSGDTVKTYETDVLPPTQTVAPNASISVTNRVFAGAKVTQIIDDYQSRFDIKRFDLMIDWGWFYFIVKPMFWLLDHIYKLVGNFGIAILCLTVIVKAVFFPLANRSYMSMAKMKAVQPQMQALRERFPDDKQKQQQELMALYKREKINPVSGCLPMVIQIPVFFALYKCIFITIEMRQAPFFGWIRDLSAPDPTNLFNLFGLIPVDPTTLPLIGHFLAIGIWPIVMGVSMFLQMKMNPAPTDPVQQVMFSWMPVIFTFMLGTFPAGLVIYWTWNNTLSVLQQYTIMRRAGVKVELWDNLGSLFRRKKSDPVATRP